MDIEMPPVTLRGLVGSEKDLMELPQPQSREVAEEEKFFVSHCRKVEMLPLCDIVDMLTDNDGQPEEFSSDEERWEYAVMVTKRELLAGGSLTFAVQVETTVSETVVR